jgi:rod shape-determining protein MreC
MITVSTYVEQNRVSISMRNLIAFFQRFRVFLVFLVLQLVALGSFFSWMSYPRTKFFNTSSAITGGILSWKHEVTKYLSLAEANQQLQDEIVALREEMPESYISIDAKTVLINDTLYKQAYRYIPATVINSSHQHKNNYFTIDAGRLKGIAPKMGVVSSEGVVGIVYDVSDHFAVVKSILTENINFSAYIEGSTAFGILKYLDNDPRRVSLTGISNDILIKRGALVKTRGSGGYFPKGLTIGKVDVLEPVEGKPLWDIKIRLSQDMRRVHHVYVVENILADELKRIQEKINELN